MRETQVIRTSEIMIYGELWQPGFKGFATIKLSDADIAEIIAIQNKEANGYAELDMRVSVRKWLQANRGRWSDYSAVIDFSYDISTIDDNDYESELQTIEANAAWVEAQVV